MAVPVERRSNRRALVLAAGGLAVVLVVVVVATVLGGGGGGGGGELPAPRAAGPRAATTTTAPLAPGERPGETFEVFATKNPFTPLVGTTPGTTPTTAPGTTAPGGPTTTVAGGVGEATTTTAGVEPRRAQRVALLEIFTDGGERVATVRVNDTVYERLRPGDTFAVNYKVVALEERCGTFLFGDDRFRLCVGEEVLK
jgi:hypothetical protein